MKGILIKDYYIIRGQMLILLCVELLLLIAAACSGAAETASIVMIALLCSASIPAKLIALDEKSRFDRMSQTMPYSRRAQVTSKYIIALGLTVSLLVIYTLLVLLFSVLGIVEATTFKNLLQIACHAGAISLLLPTVGIPCYYKFGSEKGMIPYLIFVGITTAVTYMPFFISSDSESADTQFLQSLGELPYIMILLSVILFTCSYLLSLSIYRKKEF